MRKYAAIALLLSVGIATIWPGVAASEAPSPQVDFTQGRGECGRRLERECG